MLLFCNENYVLTPYMGIDRLRWTPFQKHRFIYKSQLKLIIFCNGNYCSDGITLNLIDFIGSIGLINSFTLFHFHSKGRSLPLRISLPDIFLHPINRNDRGFAIQNIPHIPTWHIRSNAAWRAKTDLCKPHLWKSIESIRNFVHKHKFKVQYKITFWSLIVKKQMNNCTTINFQNSVNLWPCVTINLRFAF